MALEKIVPIKIDGRMYNIPISAFTIVTHMFNKRVQVGNLYSVVGLWKISWGDNVKTVTPSLQFQIGWEKGPLNDESNMRPHNSLNTYWIFQGFFINSEPLHITFKDTLTLLQDREYRLSLAQIDPALLHSYSL